jgi:serine/threonine protein kinase
MDDFASLARCAGEPASAWAARLIDDLAARDQRAARLPVEMYLDRLPGLQAEREVVCDLIVAEWTLRRQASETVTLAEYVRRFPAWAKELGMLWDADQQNPSPDGETAPLAAVATRWPDWYVGPASFPVVFGAYRLLREFEGGGMGRIFLAEPLMGGAAVALKVPRLHPGRGIRAIAEHATRLQRFLREALVTQQLSHPRLCRALDVDECDGLPYFTMPYYPNGSVAGELQDRGQFAPADAARLVADVARALQHAHERGFVHRDLKPSNLLRDDQGQVVVTDFGLVLTQDPEELRLTGYGFTPGTPLYFSPEQARGERNPTPASDVFSLGVILYELLSARSPFAAEGVLELLLAIDRASPTPLEQLRPDVPPALAAICRRALAREPGGRYPSMTEFADDLERFLSDTWVSPVTATGELERCTVEDTPRPGWRPRRGWLVGLGGALAVVAGCFVAFRGFFGGPSTATHSPASPPSVERAVLSTRKPIGLRGQLQLLHDDLDQLDVGRRERARYFSLMAVRDNPYVSNEEFNLHLDALRRVLNRLSRNVREVPVNPDASGCLLRIDLDDLGWDTANEWFLILQAEPYRVRYDTTITEEPVRRLALDIVHLTANTDWPCVRADWFIAAASRAPLYDLLQKSDGQDRRTPPFDLGAADEPLARVVRLYQGNAIDAHVAAAELGLGTAAELEARWPPDKPDLRNALDLTLSRDRWAGDNGPALFADHVRALKLGVPRAAQDRR